MPQGVNGYIDFDTDVSWAKVRVNYNETYNIEKNESVLTITSIQAKTTSYYGYTWYLDGIIKVDDKNVVVCNSGTGNSSVTMNSKNTWYTAKNSSGSINIQHGQDGTKQVKISINKNQYSKFFFHSDSHSYPFKVTDGTYKNVNLTTIPRSSSILEARDKTLNEFCYVSWIPNSTSFSYRLKFSLGDWNYSTDVIVPNKTTLYEYTSYQFPLDIANQIPNSDRRNMNVELITYSDKNGNNKVGSSSNKTITVYVPENIKPRISTLNVTLNNDINSIIKNWNIAVAGFTGFNIDSFAIGASGSTISSFQITESTEGYYSSVKAVNGRISYKTSVFNKSGIKKISIVCIDSRNRKSEVVVSSPYSFLSYSYPNILRYDIKRIKNASTGKNEKISVNIDWSISSLNNKNIASCNVYYRKQNESKWTQYRGSIKKGVDTELIGVLFDETSSYVFRIKVADSLGNFSEVSRNISTINVLLDFKAGGKGLGVGKIAETDSMEIGMPIKIFGDIEISKASKINGYVLTDFVIEEGTFDIWKYRKWYSGISECWGSKNVASRLDTPWQSLFRGVSLSPINYPSNLFISRPMENVSIHGNRDSWIANTNSNTKGNTGSYDVVCPTASDYTEAITYDFYVKGNWK